ncbi:MAG: hypothetical protein JNM79_20375 [Burkholderiales bacterium]|nr:hypothetical protein [Burkholderiales bacterium]
MRKFTPALLVIAAALAAPNSRADETWLPPIEESVLRAEQHYAHGAYSNAYADFFAAAIRGHARSQEIIGMMLLLGPEVYGPAIQRDRERALLWLGEAAGRGREVAGRVARAIESRNAAGRVGGEYAASPAAGSGAR